MELSRIITESRLAILPHHAKSKHPSLQRQYLLPGTYLSSDRATQRIQPNRNAGSKIIKSHKYRNPESYRIVISDTDFENLGAISRSGPLIGGH